MAEEKASQDDDLDEHGLAIQRFQSTVLLVVPPSAFSEETLRHTRSCLHNVHVGTRTVSTQEGDLIQGHLQDEFQVDGPLKGEGLEAYSGVVFVGGPGAAALAEDADVLRLAREASEGGKLLAAWGESVVVLARADVLRGMRVTGLASHEDELRAAGGRFTANELELHGMLVTGRDNAAGLRFSKALAGVVAI